MTDERHAHDLLGPAERMLLKQFRDGLEASRRELEQMLAEIDAIASGDLEAMMLDAGFKESFVKLIGSMQRLPEAVAMWRLSLIVAKTLVEAVEKAKAR